MKKLVAIAVFAAFALCGCRCTAEKNAVAEIEQTMTLEDAEYLKYVEADPKLDAASKSDRKKLIESRQRLLSKLKKSLE